MIYLKNVSLLELERRNKSYGKPTRTEAILATMSSNFLTVHIFAPAGHFTTRYNMNAKYFVELEKYTEIKESTFNKHFKRLENEASERMNIIKAEQVEAANKRTERVEAVKVKVLARKDWLIAYLIERGLQLNDLSRHKVANLYAFKLCSRFDCGMSDLRSAFKQLF